MIIYANGWSSDVPNGLMTNLTSHMGDMKMSLLVILLVVVVLNNESILFIHMNCKEPSLEAYCHLNPNEICVTEGI